MSLPILKLSDRRVSESEEITLWKARHVAAAVIGLLVIAVSALLIFYLYKMSELTF
jgi:hypothetical protein